MIRIGSRNPIPSFNNTFVIIGLRMSPNLCFLYMSMDFLRFLKGDCFLLCQPLQRFSFEVSPDYQNDGTVFALSGDEENLTKSRLDCILNMF